MIIEAVKVLFHPLTLELTFDLCRTCPTSETTMHRCTCGCRATPCLWAATRPTPSSGTRWDSGGGDPPMKEGFKVAPSSSSSSSSSTLPTTQHNIRINKLLYKPAAWPLTFTTLLTPDWNQSFESLRGAFHLFPEWLPLLHCLLTILSFFYSLTIFLLKGFLCREADAFVPMLRLSATLMSPGREIDRGRRERKKRAERLRREIVSADCWRPHAARAAAADVCSHTPVRVAADVSDRISIFHHFTQRIRRN